MVLGSLSYRVVTFRTLNRNVTPDQSLIESVETAENNSPRRLRPGECVSGAGTVADRTFGGAALVFEVPYDITQERPLILESQERSHGGEVARIELDL